MLQCIFCGQTDQTDPVSQCRKGNKLPIFSAVQRESDNCYVHVDGHTLANCCYRCDKNYLYQSHMLPIGWEAAEQKFLHSAITCKHWFPRGFWEELYLRTNEDHSIFNAKLERYLRFTYDVCRSSPPGIFNVLRKLGDLRGIKTTKTRTYGKIFSLLYGASLEALAPLAELVVGVAYCIRMESDKRLLSNLVGINVPGNCFFAEECIALFETMVQYISIHLDNNHYLDNLQFVLQHAAVPICGTTPQTTGAVTDILHDEKTRSKDTCRRPGRRSTAKRSKPKNSLNAARNKNDGKGVVRHGSESSPTFAPTPIRATTYTSPLRTTSTLLQQMAYCGSDEDSISSDQSEVASSTDFLSCASCDE